MRVVSDAEDERCAQAMNSTSHVSAVAGNRGQAGQQQYSDPPALGAGAVDEPGYSIQAGSRAARSPRTDEVQSVAMVEGGHCQRDESGCTR